MKPPTDGSDILLSSKALSAILEDTQQLANLNIDSHLEHLLIRTSRAVAVVNTAKDVGNIDELFTRLISRAEELIDGLDASSVLSPGSANQLSLRKWMKHALAIRNNNEHNSSKPSTSGSILDPISLSQTPVEVVKQNELSSEFSYALALHRLLHERAQVLGPGTTLASALSPIRRAKYESAVASLEMSTSNSGKRRHLSQNSLTTPGVEEQTIQEIFRNPPSFETIRRELWKQCQPLIPAKLLSVKATLENTLLRRYLHVEDESHDASTVTSPLLKDPVIDEDCEEMMADLRTLVQVLGKLCAPARDAEVSALLWELSTPSVQKKATAYDLARKVFIIQMEMGADLRNFDDHGGHALLRRRELSNEEEEVQLRLEAIQAERKAVTEHYGISSDPISLDEANTNSKARSTVHSDPITAKFREWIEAKTGVTSEVRKKEDRNSNWQASEIVEAFANTLFSDVAVGLPPSPITFTQASNISLSQPNRKTADTNSIQQNLLPPCFFIPSPRIFKLQNKIQALIIVACLLAVAQLPAAVKDLSASTPALDVLALKHNVSSSPVYDWVQRIWLILLDEVEASVEEVAGVKLSKPDGTPLTAATKEIDRTREGTKLEHLSQEIVEVKRRWAAAVPSHSQLTSTDKAKDLPPFKEEIERIRNGVARVLRYEDPAYKLLKSRLKMGLTNYLNTSLSSADDVPALKSWTPAKLRTGRSLGPEKTNSAAETPTTISRQHEYVKGFDQSEFLKQQVMQVFAEAKSILDWSKEVWGDRLTLSPR